MADKTMAAQPCEADLRCDAVWEQHTQAMADKLKME